MLTHINKYLAVNIDFLAKFRAILLLADFDFDFLQVPCRQIQLPKNLKKQVYSSVVSAKLAIVGYTSIIDSK
jgi:hypothetical protein